MGRLGVGGWKLHSSSRRLNAITAITPSGMFLSTLIPNLVVITSIILLYPRVPVLINYDYDHDYFLVGLVAGFSYEFLY